MRLEYSSGTCTTHSAASDGCLIRQLCACYNTRCSCFYLSHRPVVSAGCLGVITSPQQLLPRLQLFSTPTQTPEHRLSGSHALPPLDGLLLRPLYVSTTHHHHPLGRVISTLCTLVQRQHTHDQPHHLWEFELRV